jgi:PAS domain S-box-containing protein
MQQYIDLSREELIRRLRDAEALARDAVAERECAEDEARQRLREIEDLYRNAPVGLCVLDRELRWVRINERLAEFNGIPAADHIGKRLTELLPELAEACEPGIRAVLETGEPSRNIEFVTQTPAHPGVARSWLGHLLPILDEQGQVTGLSIVVEETTARKQAEEALRDADRRKDAFLATLAHELRNPLVPIRNAVEILRYKGPPDPTLHRLCDLLDRQVRHLARLIDDLLDVNRISRGKLQLRKERVVLAAVVDQALEVARPLIEGAGHDLTVSLPRQPVHLEADPVRLAQVISNLLDNACKFTERGGRIRLSVAGDVAEVVVRVEDSGIGMAPDQLPRVFDMFAQGPAAGERVRSGLGIGLALTRGLVEMHGGRIEAQSEGPGKGSTFIVRLPAARPLPLPGGSTLEPGRDTKPCRILVVDDHPDVLESLAMLLELRGHDVATARDGLEAVEVAERFRPELMLLDLGMPRLDGYEACRRIREQVWGKNLMIVALTGWGQDSDRRRAEEARFDDHLVKPVAPSALIEVVAKAQAQAQAQAQEA